MRVVLVGVLCALVAQADARTATGYSGGEKIKLKVVDVDGKDVEAKTAKAFRKMAKAARKAGVSLAIRSGFRTHAKQKKLYKQYRKGEGNLAARPGFSNHENGRALDLVITQDRTYAWLEAHAYEFGFHRTVRGEPWHWEFLGGASRTAVERGVIVDNSPAARSPDEGYGEYACTRDWRFTQPPGQSPFTQDDGAVGAE